MAGSPHTLVLFDIDGTLVDCGAASGKGFSKAFHEAFGVPCPIFAPAEVAGFTDSAILAEVISRLGLKCDDFEERRSLAFEFYARNLAREFQAQPPRELPGASSAVQAVRSMTGLAIGLLTGSTAATARIKLESAGIAFRQFACGAYSEDADSREALPPVARGRFAGLFGREPGQTILIGDTPLDVRAALASGSDFVGVTTGHYDRSALQKAGARIVLDDLSQTERLRYVIEELRDR
jgi:phosphoglycolate phosphatase-like HAD superfamily hydrolase